MQKKIDLGEDRAVYEEIVFLEDKKILAIQRDSYYGPYVVVPGYLDGMKIKKIPEEEYKKIADTLRKCGFKGKISIYQKFNLFRKN